MYYGVNTLKVIMIKQIDRESFNMQKSIKLDKIILMDGSKMPNSGYLYRAFFKNSLQYCPSFVFPGTFPKLKYI